MRTRSLISTIALVVMVAGCGSQDSDGLTVDPGQSVSTEPRGTVPATLQVTEFAERVEAGATVIDVRTAGEFDEGHLNGAQLIDVSDPSFSDTITELDKDATYAVYCATGNRSDTAVQIMADNGFTDVAHLDGGIVAWEAANKPVVTY